MREEGGSRDSNKLAHDRRQFLLLEMVDKLMLDIFPPYLASKKLFLREKRTEKARKMRVPRSKNNRRGTILIIFAILIFLQEKKNEINGKKREKNETNENKT